MDHPSIGYPVATIDTPALVICLEDLEYNIATMANFFRNKIAKLRPHVKTHKTPFLANKQMKAGAIGITCQKLSEAEVMARAGIRDILIANQIVSEQKIKRLIQLARYNDIKVAVDSKANIQDISKVAQNEGVTVGILVEVDVGMNRCGVPPGNPALQLAAETKKHKNLRFMGLMGYEGHTVFIPSYAERTREATKALALLVETKKLAEDNGLECLIVSAGATGTYDIAGSFPGVTEVQAGSYVTMDAKYNTVERIGGVFRQALTLLATVISRPSRDRAVIDAGMKSISYEFGMPTVKIGHNWLELSSLAEEHGIIQLPSSKIDLDPGEVVELIPTHGCTTFNLHDYIYCVRDGIVEGVWPIEARGKFL